MAKTSKNVLGDQRGRIGKVVGKVIDGVQMYSAHTDAVKNPRTEKQIAHRARFAEAMRLSKAMKAVIKIGFKRTAAKQKLISPSNIFFKENKSKISYNKKHWRDIRRLRTHCDIRRRDSLCPVFWCLLH